MILTPSRKSPVHGSTKAMTLVEVIVAMCVMTLVLLGALSSAVKAATETSRSKMIYRQTAILNDKIEEMRAMQFSSLLTTLTNADTKKGVINDTKKEKSLAGANTYIWERTTSETITAGSTTLVTVTVKVYPSGQPSRALSVSTQFSKSGLLNKNT